MDTIEEQYKGYIISYLKVPLMDATFQVMVGSEDRNLMLRLDPRYHVVSGHDYSDAIAKAKSIIDTIA
jgi:hypothetical protein